MSEYDDIINLPHHRSVKRPHMSIYQRAAQFAPFAALTGYDAAIDETSRLTDQKLELSDEQADNLNAQIQRIIENVADKPQVEITYFVPDNHKSGGEYVTVTECVRRVDDHNREIVFTDGMTVGIDDVWNIRVI